MRSMIALSITALVVVAGAGAGVSTQTADVLGQMDPTRDVVAEDGATIQRSESGISVKLRMPTPQSGTYMYPGGNAFQPTGAIPGHPEAFSLWVFVFNYPALCSAPCDANDLGATTPAQGGAFNGGGHIVGGRNLSLSGHVSTNTSPLFDWMSPLLEPRTAEIHLAVAPHGELQPEFLPNQITKPIGSPAFWWIAIFP